MNEPRAVNNYSLAAGETVAIELSHIIADPVSNSLVSEQRATLGHDGRCSTIGMKSSRMTSPAALIKKSFGIAITMQKLISN